MDEFQKQTLSHARFDGRLRLNSITDLASAIPPAVRNDFCSWSLTELRATRRRRAATGLFEE
jgi:hypothetical protein